MLFVFMCVTVLMVCVLVCWKQQGSGHWLVSIGVKQRRNSVVWQMLVHSRTPQVRVRRWIWCKFMLFSLGKVTNDINCCLLSQQSFGLWMLQQSIEHAFHTFSEYPGIFFFKVKALSHWKQGWFLKVMEFICTVWSNFTFSLQFFYALCLHGMAFCSCYSHNSLWILMSTFSPWKLMSAVLESLWKVLEFYFVTTVGTLIEYIYIWLCQVLVLGPQVM